LGKGARGITFWQQGGEVAVETEGRLADEIPELAQLGDACLPGIAGDDGGVDRPDRDARDPIGVEVGLGQCFVDARLVGTERAATLQQKRDAVEGRPMLQLVSLFCRCGDADTALAVSLRDMSVVSDAGLIGSP
jgi:hypothetical protein